TSACRGLRRARREPARGSAALPGWSWQLEFARKRREMPFHLGRAHRGERGRSPARPLVLVYDHRSDPFVEVVPTHHAGDYAELGAHARGEIERRTAPHLGKCDLETRRRFC